MAQLIALFLIVIGLPQALNLENIILNRANTLSTILSFIIDVVVIFLIIEIILKRFKNELIFKILEAYIVVLGSGTVFFLLIDSIFSNYISFLYVLIISFTLSFSLLIIKSKKRSNFRIRNVTTLVSSIGVGILIGVGFGNVLFLYLLIAAFAVYDYIAVFVLKFMIPLAKQAMKMDLSFMIVSSDMESVPKKEVSKKERAAFNKAVKHNKNFSEHLSEVIKRGEVPLLSSIMLGNGDIMLPAAVATGSYAATANLFLSFLIIVFSGMGVLATMFILRKYKVGLPAIPPIFSFISLAFAIFFILEDPSQVFYIIIFLVASVAFMSALLLTLKRKLKK
ncbi:MAG: presenilin family intramembrane aspartyl protease [Candidatus Micrarchaeia archaeon]